MPYWCLYNNVLAKEYLIDTLLYRKLYNNLLAAKNIIYDRQQFQKNRRGKDGKRNY